ncbi:MAG: FAD-binding oxidoreductase [Terriglobales bacterium]
MARASAGPGVTPELRAALTKIVGEQGCLFDPQETAPFCEDWRQLHKGSTPAVVRPASTEEVAAVVRLCAERHIPLVPQGGNTSMVNGATPSADGDELVLSLARMNKIRALDVVDLTMTVEAGVPLKVAQDAALAEDCMLPLSMGSEGSAQIGGVLSTNAGGNNALRYGNARELVLGLEVVLPDGEIWDGLRRLRKDNTGYCLRQLFVGAEGTLGIITAGVLKLAPRPHDVVVALCAVPSVQAALDLFILCRRHHYHPMQAFEYMSGDGMELVRKHISGAEFPLAKAAGHYVLVELADSACEAGLREKLEAVLEKAADAGLVQDAVLAGSSAERAALWRLREEQSEAQKREAASVKNDVSVPVSKVAEFITAARAACERRFPGVRAVPFGHIGDGNIHFNVLAGVGTDNAAFLARSQEVMDTVNEVVRQFDGSFSAEHGIGRLKPYMMEKWRGGAELGTMRRIKAALDPLGIMNPGKVLPG